MQAAKEEFFRQKKVFVMDLKKKAMAKSWRMVDVVRHTKCKAPGCSCNGWKEIEDMSLLTYADLDYIEFINVTTGNMEFPNYQQDNENFYTLPPCSTCKHQFSAHESNEKWQRNPALIDYTLRLLVDIGEISKYEENVEDLGSGFFASLVETLMNAVTKSVTLEEIPTGELQPYIGIPLITMNEASLQDSVAAFVFLVSRGVPEQEKYLSYELGVLLVTYFNGTIYETPSERKATTGEEDPLYTYNYGRWFLYSHLPEIYLCLTHFYPALIMGPTFFCQVYAQLHERMFDNTIGGESMTRHLLRFISDYRDAVTQVVPAVMTGMPFINNSQDYEEFLLIKGMILDCQPPIGDAHVNWFAV